MRSLRLPHIHAILGSAVVAIGAWLAWDRLSLPGAAVVFAAMSAFLLWRGKTLGSIWAWSTLFLGTESFIWPIITMAQIRSTTAEPSDEQMGVILSALVMGLFSAVFWLAFSYGLFKRAGSTAPSDRSEKSAPVASSRRKQR